MSGECNICGVYGCVEGNHKFSFTYGDRCQVYYEREYVKFCNDHDLTIDWKWFRREFNRRVKEGYFNEIR